MFHPRTTFHLLIYLDAPSVEVSLEYDATEQRESETVHHTVMHKNTRAVFLF